MASIFKRPSGSWTVEVYLDGRKKRKINLPTKSQREARRVADNIQRLVNCRKSGLEPDDLLPWIDKIHNDGPAIYKRLGELGLVKFKEEVPKHELQEVVGMLENTISSKKTNTRNAFSVAMNIMFRYFPKNTFIEDVDSLRVFQFVTWLRSPSAKITGGTFSEATISRAIGYFRSVFSLAVQFGWISENPFLDIKKGSMANTENWHYISKDFVVEKISKHDNKADALCVALARFAGIRGLSELLPLKWEHIKFSDKIRSGHIIIHAPKVKGSRHETRTVPLSPLLERLLSEWRIGNQTEFVFGNVKLKETTCIARSVLGDGIPVPWYNLRKSFCSDVMETGVDMKVYESICGHRWTIGEKYYQILHPDRMKAGMEKVASHFSGDKTGDSEQKKTEQVKSN